VLQSGFSRLTRAEYRATIKDAFGVDADVSGIPEDGRVGPYTSNIAFASDPVQPFLLASEDLAALIVPGKLPTCCAATASTCISTSYGKPFERLFRRPVAATEVDRVVDDARRPRPGRPDHRERDARDGARRRCCNRCDVPHDSRSRATPRGRAA
jgi:hypothetical protein